MTTEVVTLDLDTTIYDTSPRAHLIDRVNGTDWLNYAMHCHLDLPGPALPLAQLLTKIQFPFAIVSGRHQAARNITLERLHADGVHPWKLEMSDSRQVMGHAEWKALKLLELQEQNNWTVLFHVEDVTEVAIECEKVGIPTMLVHNVKAGILGLVG